MIEKKSSTFSEKIKEISGKPGYIHQHTYRKIYIVIGYFLRELSRNRQKPTDRNHKLFKSPTALPCLYLAPTELNNVLAELPFRQVVQMYYETKDK